MRNLTMRAAINEALRQEMEADERVFIFGEDVAGYGGIENVTTGLRERFGPDRVFDTPISESGFTGLAVGAAMVGRRPVIELQFTGALTIALDQLANSAAKMRYASNGGYSAPLVVRTVNMSNGNVYTGQALEAWVAHVPGLKVVAPSTPADAKGLLIASIQDPDPVVFVEHTGLYNAEGPVAEEPVAIPLGQASVQRRGDDVTVVSWLNMVPVALEAAEELASEGIGIEVIDARTLVPFDLDTVLRSVRKTGRLVIVHEAVRRGGFGAEVSAMVAESDAFDRLKAPIIRVANPGVPVPHSAHLSPYVLPDKSDVIAGIRRVLESG
ncbi:MAG: alpha-ketoacid dehydrogenase subunit beta [Dehalococcoidia bacterium]|jgi:pyruvate dehydrogenase E1 component beta subunit|nr:alpha-ketoacid dehydrogenase subunit beta [Dehalococcoidia bacterium]